MFEVKRKPNSPGSGSAASTRTEASTDTDSSALRHESAENFGMDHTVSTTLRRALGPPPIVVPPPPDAKDCQTKLPVITGEAQYKGTLKLDAMVSGQPGGSGGSLSVRQKSRSFSCEPEFSGEISFRDAIRVNGHIAGSVYSRKGTLIVDISATVDANVEVAVAVIGGTVKGDIVAHERVEIGPSAKIYGNIWTRSIEIKNGAIFEGVCTMIAEEQVAG